MTAHEALNTITYQTLKKMILNGELDFNTIYSETKLSSELGVSRTPFREALMRLNQEFYVDIIPSKGFTLHKPGIKDLINASHFRLAVEGYCASIIASNIHNKDYLNIILEMDSILSMQRAVADEAHIKRFWLLDTQFHTLLVSHLNNPYFDSLYASCNHFFTSLPVSNFFSEQRHLSTLKEHQVIIDALKSGNPERAQKAVTFHVNESLRIIAQDNMN